MASSTPAFQSFSVPTSPAMSRASSKGQPVTPQRLPRNQHRYSQSAHKSPNTPNTPYTPLSLRSSDSTGSSTLTTPDNSSFLIKKRLVRHSPEVHHANSSMDNVDLKDKSLADLAPNWRMRASQHGIKVSPSAKNANDSHFGDDEASDITSSDIGNDSSIISTDEALLPPPFLSYHRRSMSQNAARPRALSNVSLPENMEMESPCAPRKANMSMPLPNSPVRVRRALGNLNQPSILCTPPPNRVLSSHLKMQGSLTDPQPRKREAFGSIAQGSNNVSRANMSMNINIANNKSLDLFDINEHDLEYANELQSVDQTYDESFSLDLQSHTANIFSYSNQMPEPFYKTPNSFATDPFNVFDSSNNAPPRVLNSIAESVEHHFHTLQQHPPAMRFSSPNFFVGEPLFNQMPIPAPAFPKPMYAPVPMMPVPAQPFVLGHSPSLTPVNFAPAAPKAVTPPKADSLHPPTDCSVCLASYPSSLAVLQPCRHPLCSGCLTSALNIVGEKDMQCAVCKTAVADFKLVSVKRSANFKENAGAKQIADGAKEDATASGLQSLESAFEFEFADFADGLRASTPKLEQQNTRDNLNSSISSDNSPIRNSAPVILRIDNVPWDITPNAITAWLQQPVERVHVLLDNKGKTMSHAYVEVKDSSVAGAILRGESAKPNAAGRKERGSVLGKGKRARGVTVTRSSQEELMSNLFPSWRGRFDGTRPSLAGLEGDGIIRAFEGGLLTDNDLGALRRLIQSPDSHFLKVPVLPFYCLISMLSKFPSDVDSRVFWSTLIRDRLFDLVLASLQILISRTQMAKKNDEYTLDLVVDLARTAMGCKVFTAQQMQRVAELLNMHSISLSTFQNDSLRSDNSGETSTPSDSGSLASVLRTPEDRELVQSTKKATTNNPERPFDDLAKEFGVDAHIVHALAQRLAALA
ncbi:hypothetical protein FA15DRAFT_659135 [Coprinopsis marcescibilis]|uniref:RING-type domain-containing protein n=1 Tax=Coprinopsis marcescibilis TaxID=230819 RepID=A0A5C3KKG1_COPMA|nr:hypothetical protein FA15DRAFT_659135 [Coprinopsis marcescibilis]